MTKQKAGERKRTVTVTVGPQTEAIVEALNAAMLRTPGNMGVTLTSLTGIGLKLAVKQWAAIWKVELPKDWTWQGD